MPEQIDQPRPAHRALPNEQRPLTHTAQSRLASQRWINRKRPQHRADTPVDWFPAPNAPEILNIPRND